MFTSLISALLMLLLLGCQQVLTNPALDGAYQAEYLFNKSEMLAVSINMDPVLFEIMAAENHFSPEHLSLEEVWDVRSELKVDGTKAYPNYYNWYNADISIDGVPLNIVGIRSKGFLESSPSPVPAFKIRTDRNISGQNLAGEVYFTFNNARGDATRIRTCLTYELFAAAEYPAPLCNLAKVDLNGEPLGIYMHVEPIKESFLRRNFGNNTGSLYEGLAAAYLDSNFLGRFEPKTDHTDPEKKDLVALIEALHSPDEELLENLSEYLNIDLFIKFWALELVSSHIDGYAGNQNNFYIYFDPEDNNRAVFIPWGADSTFISHDYWPWSSYPYPYINSKIPIRLADIPEIRQQMEAEVKRVLDEVWNTNAILDSIDNYEILIIEIADKYYFEKTGFNFEPTEQYYRDEMAELRLFVITNQNMILADLEQMSEYDKETTSFGSDWPGWENQSTEERYYLFGELHWERLKDEDFLNDSEEIGELFLRVNNDVDFMETLDPEEYKEIFAEGSLEASPLDWAIAMLLIWEGTPNLIVISLALIIILSMKGLQRQY